MTTERPPHITAEDPRGAQAAAEILRRHADGELEANITSAVRNFLTITGLVRDDEVVEEAPPAEGSRRAVDLTALDTFVEFKRRIGLASGGAPNPQYVEQLDDYLEQSAKQGRVRMGVLTDGKHWLLRWPGAGEEVRLARPYAFTLEDPDRWFTLHEWLRDYALGVPESLKPNREEIAKHFGQGSPSYQRDIAVLKAHYQENAGKETIRVKRRLWYDLLRTALGEVAYSTEGIDDAVRTVMGDRFAEDTGEMDDLFVRHTYLSAVIGMVVQASFGIDIQRLAETDPADLLLGRQLRQDTGLYGVLESDFFAWPNEVGGEPLLQTLARRVARFDWTEAPADTAATLYETVIPPEERRQLGEYYTPAWLARVMMQELVDDPLNQRVLDPACGSGTFVAEAVNHFIAAAGKTGWEPMEVLNRLREAVTGIDVHPVAVHLARAAWTLAARPAINAAGAAGIDASLSIPVYLGDALQLRYRTGDMFAEHEITIQTLDQENTDLVFPTTLVERAESFDALMGDVSTAIEQGDDPLLALDDNGINDPAERQVMGNTIASMQRLHDKGRNHIWAYYARNMVRPVVLSRSRVDVVIGNPPWINYNQTADILRDELENLSRNTYGIWAGGRYATHQDVAGLFFARSVDRYLKDGGVIGFVMPHSALQAGQYSKWRSGQWKARNQGSVQVDFTFKRAWDLERLEPNTFFPIPASVVFARKLSQDASGKALAGRVERWLGKAGADNVRRESVGIVDTGAVGESPYAPLSRQGAVIVPRRLFYVEETENTAIVQAAPTVTINPRLGGLDKPPWKDLDLTAITAQTVEAKHLFDVHLGETIAPYVTLEPLKALLPMKQGEAAIPANDRGPGGIRLGGLDRRMRERWQTVSGLWEENKAPANRLNLLGQLDYMGKLSSQLEWMKDAGERPVRVVYSSSGTPTAALVAEDRLLVDYTLFWVDCKDINEANYLLAIINSDALYEAVSGLMPKGQFGARHLQKHLWKLPIPEFAPASELHAAIVEAGAAAARKAKERLANLREQYQREGKELTVAIVRRELRAWLRTSDEGRAVESAVRKLLKN
ncbi:MAG: N-6 DNA methylase [Chloroflexota bacterium]|nr:N-6 DNA methylase [Chloroflexota bacterium]